MRARERIGQQRDTALHRHAFRSADPSSHFVIANRFFENRPDETFQSLIALVAQRLQKCPARRRRRLLAHRTVDQYHAGQPLGAEHVNILQRLDGAQRPAHEQNVAERREKLLQIGGAPLGRKTVGGKLRFALPARVQRQRVVTPAEMFELILPDRRRHRPAGHQREGQVGFFGVLQAGFEERKRNAVAGLKKSSGDLRGTALRHHGETSSDQKKHRPKSHSFTNDGPRSARIVCRANGNRTETAGRADRARS